jgi:hypothetical protein
MPREEKLKRTGIRSMIKPIKMKTPDPFHQDISLPQAYQLRQQYQQLVDKPEIQSPEVKKNMLLTPFLLSIPVIMILFILISGTSSEIPNTINAEPIQREVMTTERARSLHEAVISRDSLLHSSKVIALPAKK